MARRNRRWRKVGFAGMVGGDAIALALITHEGVDRLEVLSVLRRRWPEVRVKTVEQKEPTWVMTAEDAAGLGRCRRGIEPLRIVILPQRERRSTTLASHRADASR